MNRMLAGAAMMGALLALNGCLWVDEDVSSRTVVDPVAYEPAVIVPEPVPGLPGHLIPNTSVIRSFLGGADFRIAITLPDETAGIYVLEPGEPDQPPRILRYSRGRETFNGRVASWYARCALSPDGDRLAYSLTGAGEVASSHPLVWMLELGATSALRVPLFSRRNRSHGMIGESPYWHASGGRSFIGFLGRSLQGNDERGLLLPDAGREAQMVELLTGSQLSPVFPVRAGGERILADVRGISRDSQWVLVQKDGGQGYLLPSARASSLTTLDFPDTLSRFTAGKGASLNPFDPGSTRHSDYFAVPAFQPSTASGEPRDTVLDARTLDGRRMNAMHPLKGDNFWVCDAERRIHFSRRVGQQPLERVQWTTHPNFVLAMESFTSVYLVRLAGSTAEVLDGSGETTRRADGVLTLFGYDPMTWKGHAILDFSMWVEP